MIHSAQLEQTGIKRDRRQRAAWVVLCALLLFAAMATPFFAGHVYTCDDLAAYHLPARAFYAACLAAGQRFEWTSSLFNGFDLHAEGQVGMFHPWHLALYGWLPLQAAFCLEVLASYPLLCLGAVMFLRRQGLPRDAAWFGGLITASSSFALAHFMHVNAVAVWAHVPWLLTAIDARIAATSRRSAAWSELAIALLTSSQLLLGYPQYVWMSLLVETSFAAWKLTSSSHRVAITAWLLAAKSLGLLLAAIQWLPTLEALANSTRQSTGNEFANWGSLHPVNLVQLVAPYALAERVAGGNTHELALYFGAVPLVLLVWLAVARPRLGDGARRLTMAASLAGAVGLLLALGQYGRLYHLQALLPVIGRFRFPCRYVAVVQLAVAALAAVAFMALARRSARTTSTAHARLVAITLPLAAALITLVLLLVKPYGLELSSWPLLLAGPTLVGLATALVVAADQGARWALPALVALAMADAGAYGLSYAIWPHHAPLERVIAAVDAPPDKGQHGRRVVADLAPFDRPAHHRGNQLLLAGWPRADGYAGLAPARQLDYTSAQALCLAGVDWVGPLAAPRVPSLADDNTWTQLDRPLPRFRLVTQTRLSTDPAADLAAIDPAHVALVDRELPLDDGPVGHIAFVDYRPGAMRLIASTPGRQLLVVAESFHPGWQARIDGRSVEPIRVYGDFLGVPLPGAGTRTIELTYRPASHAWGRNISAATLVAVLGLFLLRSQTTPAQGTTSP